MDRARERFAKAKAPSRVAGLCASLLLAACASRPPVIQPMVPAVPPRPDSPRPPPADRPARAAEPISDGLTREVPGDLRSLPDAEPRVESRPAAGPNKPYEIEGTVYRPVPGDPEIVERGLASWYGRKFQGRRTASGETYDMYAMTAAHKTMPLPSYARVRNPANGHEVVVRVNDRGPFKPDRVIDLSYAAALKLGVEKGVAMVEVERITDSAIRDGTWLATLAAKRSQTPQLAAAGPQAPADAIALIGWQAGPVELPAEHAAAGYWLRFASFAQADPARRLRERLGQEREWLAPLLAVFADRKTHRVEAGPFASRDQAAATAVRLGGLEAEIVERK